MSFVCTKFIEIYGWTLITEKRNQNFKRINKSEFVCTDSSQMEADLTFSDVEILKLKNRLDSSHTL